MSKVSKEPDKKSSQSTQATQTTKKDSEAVSSLQGTAQLVKSRDLFSRLKSWSRSQLLASFTAGAGCCARELMRLEGPNPQSHLIREKFNSERIEHCDILIVSGVINPMLKPYLLRVYEKMMSPKYCVAVGTCAATGAIFDTIAVSEIIPVDVFIPGCPPSMDSLVHGVEILRDKVGKGESLEHEYVPMEAKL